ncbi:MAG TPA: ABC transporter ATP-binding protein, partial [Candidatus Krumholzibacteria bacterium]|nr:ABC transporter ATP-binding protein [Candidatus Krumholzibacteria bacterium]
MNTYVRMLRRIRRYLPQVVVSVGLTSLFALVSSLSILMVMPTFKALFAGPGSAQPAAALDQVQTFGLKGHVDHLYRRFEEWLVQGEPLDALQRVVIALVVTIFVRTVLQYLATVMTDWIGLRLVKDLRDDVFAKFLELPLGFYHRFRAGELISRATNDVQIANKTINVSFTNLVRDPAQILGFLLICLWISWKLTVLALLVLPLTMGVIVMVGKRLRRYSHRQQERLADLTSVLQETVYGIRVVKAFAMERFENARYRRESERLFTQMFKISRTQRATSPLSEQLTTLVGAVILWYGGRQVFVEHTLAPEAFLTFLGALFSMIHPIKELSGVNNGIQEGMAAADRLFEIIDSPSEDGTAPGLPELADVRGRVAFENVSFAYLPGEPVLRGIDLAVEPGQVVALVGGSGAGKSTLVNLIPRFYDPDEGRVLVDGHD